MIDTGNSLLIISEQGTLSHLQSRFAEQGWQTELVNSQRKALKSYKHSRADVILAEFIFTPDFRDRISNLDTLCTQIKALNPATSLMLVYEPEDHHALQRLNTIHPVHTAWQHPVKSEAIFTQVMAMIRQSARFKH